ncbi:sulfate transporter [Micractinium conductrix]|uniref:Sulfate transporter n=1 Tax=Micractinium conductrix TaxID=554055 RepID=A0A2P6VPR0_9CHLO|nr:sulfate transporter [Micractinium conductrix]|eukprot:PSC76083.1 sulfate transporter [Micractinium conductrix]
MGAEVLPLENVKADGLVEDAKRIVRVEKNRRVWTGQKLTWYEWLGCFIPFFAWIRTYQWKQWLLSDAAAGLSVAAMVVPQGMSYAQNLAFLPQVYGLYGAFTPCIFYALLGSSRQLAVGPVPVTSLILGTGLSDIYGKFAVNPSDPENALIAYKQQEYNVGAIQVAFIAGLFYTAVGLFRLGFIVRILSHPMIAGFMSGAVLIIASGQFKYLAMQMSLPRADTLQGNLYYLFSPQPNPRVWPAQPYPFQWRQFIILVGGVLAGFALIGWGVDRLNERKIKPKYGRIPFVYAHLGFTLQFLWSVFTICLTCYVVEFVIYWEGTPWKWRETAMGGSFLLILFIIKYVARNIRQLKFLQFLGPLIVCIISIAIMNGGKLYIQNPDDANTPLVKPVGLIPKGLARYRRLRSGCVSDDLRERRAVAFADQAAAAAVDGGASAAARFVSKLLKEHRVLIFSKSYCPYSMRGKDVMRRAVGGAVEVHAVELDQLDEGHDPGMADIQDELRALTGARTVPRVFVDGQSIGGADDVGAKAQSGELEALLRGSGIIQA